MHSTIMLFDGFLCMYIYVCCVHTCIYSLHCVCMCVRVYSKVCVHLWFQRPSASTQGLKEYKRTRQAHTYSPPSAAANMHTPQPILDLQLDDAVVQVKHFLCCTRLGSYVRTHIRAQSGSAKHVHVHTCSSQKGLYICGCAFQGHM